MSKLNMIEDFNELNNSSYTSNRKYKSETISKISNALEIAQYNIDHINSNDLINKFDLQESLMKTEKEIKDNQANEESELNSKTLCFNSNLFNNISIMCSNSSDISKSNRKADKIEEIETGNIEKIYENSNINYNNNTNKINQECLNHIMEDPSCNSNKAKKVNFGKSNNTNNSNDMNNFTVRNFKSYFNHGDLNTIHSVQSNNTLNSYSTSNKKQPEIEENQVSTENNNKYTSFHLTSKTNKNKYNNIENSNTSNNTNNQDTYSKLKANDHYNNSDKKNSTYNLEEQSDIKLNNNNNNNNHNNATNASKNFFSYITDFYIENNNNASNYNNFNNYNSNVKDVIREVSFSNCSNYSNYSKNKSRSKNRDNKNMSSSKSSIINIIDSDRNNDSLEKRSNKKHMLKNIFTLSKLNISGKSNNSDYDHLSKNNSVSKEDRKMSFANNKRHIFYSSNRNNNKTSKKSNYSNNSHRSDNKYIDSCYNNNADKSKIRSRRDSFNDYNYNKSASKNKVTSSFAFNNNNDDSSSKLNKLEYALSKVDCFTKYNNNTDNIDINNNDNNINDEAIEDINYDINGFNSPDSKANKTMNNNNNNNKEGNSNISNKENNFLFNIKNNRCLFNNNGSISNIDINTNLSDQSPFINQKRKVIKTDEKITSTKAMFRASNSNNNINKNDNDTVKTNLLNCFNNKKAESLDTNNRNELANASCNDGDNNTALETNTNNTNNAKSNLNIDTNFYYNSIQDFPSNKKTNKLTYSNTDKTSNKKYSNFKVNDANNNRSNCNLINMSSNINNINTNLNNNHLKKRNSINTQTHANNNLHSLTSQSIKRFSFNSKLTLSNNNKHISNNNNNNYKHRSSYCSSTNNTPNTNNNKIKKLNTMTHYNKNFSSNGSKIIAEKDRFTNITKGNNLLEQFETIKVFNENKIKNKINIEKKIASINNNSNQNKDETEIEELTSLFFSNNNFNQLCRNNDDDELDENEKKEKEMRKSYINDVMRESYFINNNIPNDNSRNNKINNNKDIHNNKDNKEIANKGNNDIGLEKDRFTISSNLISSYNNINRNQNDYFNLDDLLINNINNINNTNTNNYDKNIEPNHGQIKKRKLIEEKNNNYLLDIPKQFFSKKKKSPRKVQSKAFKIIDAPGLLDDYYLNLLDWGHNNQLVIGLKEKVYIWSNNNSKIQRLVSYDKPNSSLLASTEIPYVCSVMWSPENNNCAVGRKDGITDIFDTEKNVLLRSFSGHGNRVNVVSWNNFISPSNVFATGSKDSRVLLRDLRVKEEFIADQKEHTHEICGLKFSSDDGMLLASGGNDNLLNIWDVRRMTTNGYNGYDGFSHNSFNSNSIHSNSTIKNLSLLCKITEHQAAVKALAWCPNQRNVLASGGGSHDQTIKFWNTNSLTLLSSMHTGSQVCNMAFSRTSNEMISTHGYSQNQIIHWDCSDMKELETNQVLTGHLSRVLYLALSPDGSTIATAAGDETVRFWDVFPKENKKSSLFELDDNIMEYF